MKKMILAIVFFATTNALACPDFSGTWVGTCSGDSHLQLSIMIYQDRCDLVSEQFTKTPEGFSGTRYFSSPQSFVGATMVERMEYTNKKGQRAVMIETRKARWNEDQTQLLETNEFRNDVEGFLMTTEMKMSIVNGQLVQDAQGVPTHEHDYRCIFDKR